MPDPKDKQLFDELLQRRSVTIPRLMSDQPLDQQAVPDQMLTGLWNGVIGNPTDAPVAAKIGAALGEINPLNDLRTLGAVSLIPPKMAKQVGRELVDKISKEAPGMAQMWERLYEAYPRLVGNLAGVHIKPQKGAYGVHQGLNVVPDKTRGIGESFDFYKENDLLKLGTLPESRTIKNAVIGIDPVRAAGRSTADNAKTIAHELTHHAQNLMSKDFPARYTADNLFYGYHDNPYEIRANQAGERFARRFEEAEKSGTSMREARRAIRERGIPDDARQEPQDPWTWLMDKFGLSGK